MDIPSLRTDTSRCPDLQGRVLTIEVGSANPKTFHVHKNLICHTSVYFETALKDHWQTSPSEPVALKEEDPEIFEVYVHWLYFGTLPVQNDKPGLEGNAEYVQLAKAYVLGDFLVDVNFKNAVMDTMFIKSHSMASDGRRPHPAGPVIRYIYEKTPESSPPRRFLVDLFAYFGKAKWLEPKWISEDDLPEQFIRDLLTAMFKHRRPPSEYKDSEMKKCQYHELVPDSDNCFLGVSTPKRVDSERIGWESTDPEGTTPSDDDLRSNELTALPKSAAAWDCF
ncbi:hypothetical protein V8C35DRAFT_332213 [Trichoderma chlorosporum]